MAQSTKKLPNGEAVREFYSSLKIIKEYYWEKGYRKKAYLYRTLKEKLGWKMSLESFKYHFKRAIESDGSATTIKKPSTLTKDSNIFESKTIQEESKIETPKDEIMESDDYQDGPAIARPNFSKGKKWNPHTTDIDPSRIL
jgi:hypothetical protein